MVSPMQVPRRGKVNTFTEGRGSWEGYSKQRVPGFSLTEFLPGKKEFSFFLLGPVAVPGMRAPPFGL